MLLKYFAPLMPVSHGMNPCNVTNSFRHRMPALNSSCCASAPPVTLVQTHEWNRDPIDGPGETWTLRTSWTDMGSDRTCDPSRGLEDVSKTLLDRGLGDVLSSMHTLWTTPGIPGPRLWADEWNNAGTCVMTLRPECYASHSPGQEVGDFFDTIMMLYKSRPTFEWLFNEGVAPHWKRDYLHSFIERPLSIGHGAPVGLKCRGDHLVAVEYAFRLEGCFPYGRFIPIEPPKDHGNCNDPEQYLRYLPKMHEPRNAGEEKRWEVTRRKEPIKIKEQTVSFVGRQLAVPTVANLTSLLGAESTAVSKMISLGRGSRIPGPVSTVVVVPTESSPLFST